jgi:hypothetical protein
MIPQLSVLSPTLYNMYTRDTPQNTWCSSRPRFRRHLFVATNSKEGFIVRKFRRNLSSMEICCERWNFKINKNEAQGTYLSRSRLPPVSYLTVKEK